jgi:hypothetical protein
MMVVVVSSGRKVRGETEKNEKGRKRRTMRRMRKKLLQSFLILG